MDDQLYNKVVEANVAIHKTLASHYTSCEPHFKPENVAKVETKLKKVIEDTKASKLLDMGCGTGFIINIAKKYVKEIDGVDVSQDMMDMVDKSGQATITLYKSDTGSFKVKENYYDVVTGYSFLHHLYDIEPSIKMAYKALKTGGKLYCDLDPNFYYWESISRLDRNTTYHPIINREIEMVTYKDEDIEKTFGVSKEMFNHAEFGKNIAGGFKEEILKEKLLKAGFKEVEIFYYWFLGQASFINGDWGSREERLVQADIMDGVLKESLPVSRNLFKYLGFTAIK